MSDLDEAAILGETTEAVTADVYPNEAAVLGETAVTEQEEALEQTTEATEPTLPETGNQADVGRAFAAQRQALEQKHQAELELARHQAREQALRELQQQQPQQFDEMPDPTLDPEGFAQWDQRRMQAIANQYEQRLQGMAVQTSLQMASMTANMQAATFGFDWQGAIQRADAEIQQIAPLMGADPASYTNQLLASPDAGERILALAKANAARSQSAAPVDMQAVQKEAYEKALKDLQAKSAASPHSMAPRGLPPGVTVAPVKVMTEDEILSQ